MKLVNFGKLSKVSKLSLGGAGLGQVWGSTTRKESISTLLQALDDGINLLDMAPTYGNNEAELVLGEALSGEKPKNIKITTKCKISNTNPLKIYDLLDKSITNSLSRMKIDYVDILFMHNGIVDDNEVNNYSHSFRSIFDNYIVDAFEKLVKDGRIKTWGITGIGEPKALIKMLEDNPPIDYIQVVANMLNSAGNLHYYSGPSYAREIMNKAVKSGVHVLGIRPVQAGALTDKIDRKLPANHPEMIDYQNVSEIRELSKELGITTAALAHHYSLSMSDASTIVLGVKNRKELRECIEVEKLGKMQSSMIKRLDDIISNLNI